MSAWSLLIFEADLRGVMQYNREITRCFVDWSFDQLRAKLEETADYNPPCEVYDTEGMILMYEVVPKTLTICLEVP